MLSVFHYQYEAESRYLIDEKWNNSISSLDPYVDKIKIYIESIEREYIFQIPVEYLKIKGQLDILDDKKIIEIKFCKDTQINHILQCVLYYMCLNKKLDNEMEIGVLNLYTGCFSTVIFENINFTLFMEKIESIIKKITDLESTFYR